MCGNLHTKRGLVKTPPALQPDPSVKRVLHLHLPDFSFTAVVPAGPAQNRRAGVESIVSSSRFRLRSLLSWAHRAPGAAYSAIDWDAGRGVVAVGTNSGALGVMMTRHSSPMSGGGGGAGGDRPLRGFAPGRGGMQEEEGEERVCWTAAASRSCSQVC